MIRRSLRFFARIAAALLVIVIVVAPVLVMVRLAGNPFGGNMLDRITDCRVDDATILRLLSLAFYAVWAWVVVPAFLQARLSLSASTPTAARHGAPGPAPADRRGPRSWLARLVRFALTSGALATITTTTSLAIAAPAAFSPTTASATPPASMVTVAGPIDLELQGVTIDELRDVSEIVAQHRDTPYAIAVRLFPQRADEARDEIVELNLGRPTPDGAIWRGGGFPAGMTVLTPAHEQSPIAAPASTGPSAPGWLPAEAVVVEPGDTVWDLSRERLDAADGPVTQPTNAQTADHVRNVIAGNSFASGDPDLIYPGDVLQFPQIGNPPPPQQPPAPPTELPPPAAVDPAPSIPGPDPATPHDAMPSDLDPSADTAPSPDRTHVDSPAPAPPIPVMTAPPVKESGAHDPPVADGDTQDFTRTDLAGVTGAVVLASGLAVTLLRQGRRRRARGQLRNPTTGRNAEIEAAIVAASDIPFVRWASQELAQLARSIDPTTMPAVPVAVELDPGVGIEVLWDQHCHTAPRPWEATDGGWSWRVAYDPDEPTPLGEWPTPIPGLVTVGTRDGRQLLVDLDHVGTLTVTGPTDRVDEFIRAVVLELGCGDELADANVTTVNAGVGGVEHLPRVTSATVDEAISILDDAIAENDQLGAGHRSLWSRRLGPDPLLGVWATIVICGAVDPDDQARIASRIGAHRGVAAIVTTDHDEAGACVVIDHDGTATLTGISDIPIRVSPVGVPTSTAAELAVLLDDDRNDCASESLTELAPEVAAVEDVASDIPSSRRLSFADDGDIDLEAAGASLADGPDDWQRPQPEILVRVLGRPIVPVFPKLQGVRLRLLVFLACQNGGPVTFSRIRDTVWRGAARQPKTVSNALSQLREHIGLARDGVPYLPATTADGALQLHPAVMTDLAVFVALCDRARATASNEALSLYRDALTLVDGEPFDDGGYEWATPAALGGVDPQERILIAATEMHSLASEAGDLAAERFALTSGLRGVPGNERLYQLRMQLEHRADNTASVHAIYNELTHQLSALDCEPSPETEAVYRQLANRRSA
jgi:hypothetical protein